MSDQLDATVASGVATLREWKTEQEAGGARLTHVQIMDHAWALWPDLPASVIRIVVTEVEQTR